MRDSNDTFWFVPLLWWSIILVSAIPGCVSDLGWATSHARWALYAGPTFLLTVVAVSAAGMPMSWKALFGIAITWGVIYEIDYVFQYDPLHWLRGVAMAPVGSVPWQTLNYLECGVTLAQFVFEVTVAVYAFHSASRPWMRLQLIVTPSNQADAGTRVFVTFVNGIKPCASMRRVRKWARRA